MYVGDWCDILAGMDTRSTIEKTLRDQGVHTQVSEQEFAQLVDAMAREAQAQGVSAAQIEAGAPREPLFLDLSKDAGTSDEYAEYEESLEAPYTDTNPTDVYIVSAFIIGALIILAIIYTVYKRMQKIPVPQT